MVARVHGTVSVQRSGAEPDEPARLGMRLFEGDRLDVARGSRAVLLMRDGAMLKVADPIVIASTGIRNTDPAFESTATAVARVAEGSTRPQGGGRPLPGTPWAIAPREGHGVAETRPLLQWAFVEGAQAYRLILNGIDADFSLQIDLPPEVSWVYPDSLPELERGQRYSWRVIPRGGGRPAEAQRFRVLSQDEVDRLEDLDFALIDAEVAPETDGLFLRILLRAELGMYREAYALLQQFEDQEGGDTGEVYQGLKAEIESQMRGATVGATDGPEPDMDREAPSAAPSAAQPGAQPDSREESP